MWLLGLKNALSTWMPPHRTQKAQWSKPLLFSAIFCFYVAVVSAAWGVLAAPVSRLALGLARADVFTAKLILYSVFVSTGLLLAAALTVAIARPSSNRSRSQVSQ
jgi:hypothetical protein